MNYTRLFLSLCIFGAVTDLIASDLTTLRLSSPRTAVRTVQTDDMLYFVGGYKYHDQVATAEIQVFDLKKQEWADSVTLPYPRGAISSVVQGDNIYFVGGNTVTSPPAYYDLDLHAFISFNSSGPTVRKALRTSIYNDIFVVIGRFSVDFLDMGARNWTHNPHLTSVMQQLSSNIAFSHEELIIVIGGTNLTTRQRESSAWIFNITSTELKKFENVISAGVNTSRSFKYEVKHDVASICFSDVCLAYHIASSRWIQKLAPKILTGVSVPDKTFIFEPNGFWTIDWQQTTIEPSWTSRPINITFAFGVAAQACYVVPAPVTGTLLVVYEDDSWQEISAPFEFNIANVWPWTDSRVVIAPVLSTAIFFYESTERNFTTVNHNEPQSVTIRVLPFNESAILTIDSSLDTIFHVIQSDGNYNRVWSNSRLSRSDMLIGTDLIDSTTNSIAIGMDSAPHVIVNSVIFGTVANPALWARKGNFLVGIQTLLLATSYRGIDVYNYKSKTWLDIIEFPPGTSLLGAQPTVTNTSLLLFGPLIGIFNFSSRNWTSILNPFASRKNYPLQLRPVAIHDALYVPSALSNLVTLYNNYSITSDPAGTLDAFYQYFLYKDTDIYISAGLPTQTLYTTIYSFNIQSRIWQTELFPESYTHLAMALTGDFLIRIATDNKIAYYHIPSKKWLSAETPFDTGFTLSEISTLSDGTVIFGGGVYRDLLYYSDEFYFFTIDPDAILMPPQSSNVTEPQAVTALTAGELAAAIVVPIVVALIATALIIIFVIRKKKKKSKSSNMLGLENKYGAWFVDFNQIKFGDQLGQGANGQVFKGTWKNTTVALKVSMTTANSSVIRELELMMQLRPHPNVVQLLGFSVHPETESIILIIEYCNGGSLDKTLCDSGTEISPELQRQWMLGIAKGLSHLHSNNIVHRDVAARNVLLDQNEAKITDFGMSRLVDEEKRHGTTKSELGPIRWMAPESLKDRQYSTKSDVWSFGIVLNEVLSRVEPHLEADPIEIGRQIRDQGIAPTIPLDCPIELSNIMKQCWQFSPEQRPSIDQLIQQLEVASL